MKGPKVLLSSTSEPPALGETVRQAAPHAADPGRTPSTNEGNSRGSVTESDRVGDLASLCVEIRSARADDTRQPWPPAPPAPALPVGALAVSGELDLGTQHLLTRAGHQFLAAWLERTSSPALASADPDDQRNPDDQQNPDDQRNADLDLSELRFVDASGMGTLLTLRADFAAVGLRLRISNASALVRRVLALCELDTLLSPTDDDAANLPAGSMRSSEP